MSSIIGFFDGNTLRAVSIDGLLVQNKKSKYWQMRHGKHSMPFPDVINYLLYDYIVASIQCVASQHVPTYMTSITNIYGGSSKNGYVKIRMSGSNVHSVHFDGILVKNDNGRIELIDIDDTPMPLGLAFKKIESRLVKMHIENYYPNMPSILDCRKATIYP